MWCSTLCVNHWGNSPSKANLMAWIAGLQLLGEPESRHGFRARPSRPSCPDNPSASGGSCDADSGCLTAVLLEPDVRAGMRNRWRSEDVVGCLTEADRNRRARPRPCPLPGECLGGPIQDRRTGERSPAASPGGVLARYRRSCGATSRGSPTAPSSPTVGTIRLPSDAWRALLSYRCPRQVPSTARSTRPSPGRRPNHRHRGTR